MRNVYELFEIIYVVISYNIGKSYFSFILIIKAKSDVKPREHLSGATST